jgi:hypothetical protein
MIDIVLNTPMALEGECGHRWQQDARADSYSVPSLR